MEVFRFLYHFQGARLRRFFQQQRLARVITATLFVGVLVGVGLALYAFFLSGLRFINEDPTVAPVVTYYAYELFIIVLALLTAGSSLVSAVFGLFRGRDDAWVLASPRYQILLVYRTWQVLIASLWPLVLLMLPFLLAVRQVFSLGIGGLLVAMLAVLLFTVLVVLVTVVLVLLLARLLAYLDPPGGRQVPLFRQLTGAIVFLALLVTGVTWYWLKSRVAHDFTTLVQLNDVSQGLAYVTGRFELLPSHLPAAVLYVVHYGYPVWAGASLVSIICIVGAAVCFLAAAAGWYLPLWQQMQEGVRGSKADGRVERKVVASSFIGMLGHRQSTVRTLLAKERLLIYRDRQQMLWFGFLLFIWFIQTALVSALGSHGRIAREAGSSVPQMVQALQFLLMSYFISTFVLRFVYPSFSLEARSAWIIASAPVDLKKLYTAKFLFFSTAFVVIGLAIGIFNSVLLGMPVITSGLIGVAFAVATVLLVSLGLALAAWYPNFESDDPQVLSTSLPALVFIFISFLYGGLGSLLLYRQLTGVDGVVWLLLLIVVSLGLIPVLVTAGSQAVGRLEFGRSSR